MVTKHPNPENPAAKMGEPVAEKQPSSPPLVPASEPPAARVPSGKMPEGQSTNLLSGGSSKNAQKHGIYARGNVVTVDEPLENYEALHAAHREEYFADGAAEEACVTDITDAEWLKQRLNSQHSKKASATRALDKSPKSIIFNGTNEQLRQYLSDFKLLEKAAGESNLMQKAATDALTEEERKRYVEIHEKAGGKNNITERFGPNCEDLELYLTLMALLDTRIDKATKRLITLKEFKRLYGKREPNPTA